MEMDERPPQGTLPAVDFALARLGYALQTGLRLQPDSQLTPRQIFRLYDAGTLSREQLREALVHHAHELIEEMEDVHANPQASWLEGMVNKHHAARLVRAHGEPIVREIMLALSELPDFAPARFLWNADRADVPLHCFVRTRREPLFRIIKVISAPFTLEAIIEHGAKGALIKEQFSLERDRFGQMLVRERRVLG